MREKQNQEEKNQYLRLCRERGTCAKEPLPPRQEKSLEASGGEALKAKRGRKMSKGGRLNER